MIGSHQWTIWSIWKLLIAYSYSYRYRQAVNLLHTLQWKTSRSRYVMHASQSSQNLVYHQYSKQCEKCFSGAGHLLKGKIAGTLFLWQCHRSSELGIGSHVVHYGKMWSWLDCITCDVLQLGKSIIVLKMCTICIYCCFSYILNKTGLQLMQYIL